MDTLSTLFRINILDRFHIYYAYDVTTSKIQLSSNNTHEFIIGFKSCPGQNKTILFVHYFTDLVLKSLIFII